MVFSLFFERKTKDMSYVLITGGSEGIGRAFSMHYAHCGYDLILAARNEWKLVEIKTEIENQYQNKVEIIPVDLSLIGNAEELYERIKEKDVSIVINNAGVGYTDYAWNVSVCKEEQMVVLNDISLMTLTKPFVKDMKEKGKGTIINVASTGAFQPGPYIAGYYASKSFVLSYTQAIHEEVKEYGVQVYCVCPGPVKTDFYGKSGLKVPKNAMHSEKVVSYVSTHMKDKCVIVPGLLNRVVRFLPVNLKMFFVKRMKKKVLKKKKDSVA